MSKAEYLSHSDIVIPDLTRTGFFAGINGFAKRLFDVTLALAVFVFTLPLLVTIALIIKFSDGGPVLFRHIRCGRCGEAFRIYKFRTMKVDSEERLNRLLSTDPAARAEWKATQKLRHDPRTTRLGVFLRRTSLDELPQLINILQGQMSVIGPRPVTYEELERYGKDAGFYMAARPGVTGLWQVNGRNRLSYERRIAYDVEYVRDWTFARDLKIMAKTVPAVILLDGAY